MMGSTTDNLYLSDDLVREINEIKAVIGESPITEILIEMHILRRSGGVCALRDEEIDN
jgi:hypothetical protein